MDYNDRDSKNISKNSWQKKEGSKEKESRQKKEKEKYEIPSVMNWIFEKTTAKFTVI